MERGTSARLIHADFCVDSAFEVIATPIDPEVVGAQLNSRGIVFLHNTRTSVAFLDCVRSAMVLDTKVPGFREVSAVGLELVVYEKCW